MLQRDPDKRPSIDDIIQNPQVTVCLREKKIKEEYTMMKRREEEMSKKEEELKNRESELDRVEEKLNRRDEEQNRREEELKQKASKLEELEHNLLSLRTSMESAQMNMQMNTSSSRNNISTISSNLSALKNSARKSDFARYSRDRSFTKASTASSKKKPPTIRKSFRENSVGSKLRYQLNKENVMPNKAFPTKYNLSGYIKYKDRKSSRNRETSSSHTEFRPPLSSYTKQ